MAPHSQNPRDGKCLFCFTQIPPTGRSCKENSVEKDPVVTPELTVSAEIYNWCLLRTKQGGATVRTAV